MDVAGGNYIKYGSSGIVMGEKRDYMSKRGPTPPASARPTSHLPTHLRNRLFRVVYIDSRPAGCVTYSYCAIQSN